MWTQEQRDAAADRARKRWADPEFKAIVVEKIKTPPACPDCGESAIEQFYTDKKGRRTNKVCRECHKKKCNQRWHGRSQLDRWLSRNHKYGISKENLLNMLEKQEGKCAICKQPPKNRALHVDHCHATEKVRGLLCHGCNTGIGLFRDNPLLLQHAINYLGASKWLTPT